MRAYLNCFQRLPSVWLIGLSLVLGSVSAQEPPAWQWAGVARVVAFGDVHGAYDQLVDLLETARVIDAEQHWVGGETHLVSVGDLLDRGADSRRVMDLLIALQNEAAEAGGAVHLVLGNHELMNLNGDLRYVAAGEYAAFADDEPAALRESGFDRFRRRTAGEFESDEAARTAFDAAYPRGFFAHRAAFSPDDAYGEWLLQQPVLLVVNDTVFVHGGLPQSVAELGGDEINRLLKEQLRQYLDIWHELVDAELLAADSDFYDRVALARSGLEALPLALQTELAPKIDQLAALSDSIIFDSRGPLWYRGDSLCHPLTESTTLTAALNELQAARVAVGHTPTADRRVTSRMGGRVLMMDTGMLKQAYHGRPSALIIEDGEMQVVYADDGSTELPQAELRRVGSRPGLLDDDQLERFLETAEVIASEPVGRGVTQPERLTLRQDGVEIRAILSTLTTDDMVTSTSRTNKDRLINHSDQFRYQVAAYRLDRMLVINMVPVTVLREVDGRAGSLQLWIENAIDLRDKIDQGISSSGWCPLDPQHQLMYVFDALIYNDDRTQENILYSKDDWMLRLIDHIRTFRTHRGRPADLKKIELQLSPALVARLRTLDEDALNAELGELLNRRQIKAILSRRDRIIKDWES